MSTEESRIYVADLAEYNNGNLRGEWLTVTDFADVEDLKAHIAAFLAERGHEEYAIHDYETLPSGLGEYPDLDTVWAIAKLIDQHDAVAVIAFCDHFDFSAEDLGEKFTESYCGHFDDGLVGYAYQLIDECYDLEKTMGNLACYFDYEAFARDLELNGKYFESEGHVFRADI